MPDIIKNIFKYGELRRTIFLNAHNKDDYGRHRGQVLYGMTLTGTGTVLGIAPGALYTSQGQRLFFDAVDGTIDIGPSTIDAFGTAQHVNLPIVVMLYLSYQFDQAQVAKGIDVTTAVGQSALFTLSARIMPYDRNNGAPTYNLLPRDPVYLDTFQPSSYSSIQTWNGPAVVGPISVNKQNTSIQFGEIPLGYVMIGVDPVSGAFPTSLSSPGVSLVNYANPFDMISALIGQDVLVPMQPNQVTAALVQAVTGTAVRQGYSASVVGGGVSPPLVRPAYGTPEPGSSTTRADTAFATYRQPNFLKDGVSLIEALRRMDVVLRQWLNFTGKQDLINITQDGGSSLPLQATLDVILTKFDGGLSASTNLNAAVWPNGASGSDPTNHALKEGVIPHVENTVLGKLGTTEGDSVRTALAALDVALSVVIGSVLGESIPRSQLRDVSGSSYTPVSYDERPEGRPALARPTVGGSSVNIYKTAATLRQAVTEALSRTLSGPGVNMLSNFSFWAGDVDSGDQTTPPTSWAITIGTGTWTRTGTQVVNRPAKAMAISLGTNAIFEQAIVDAATNNYIGSSLRSASHISFSLVVRNTGATPIVARVIGYSDTGATSSVFQATSDQIVTGSDVRIVTVTIAIGATDIINHLKFQILSVGGGACTFTIYGAAVNTGMPITSPALSSLPHDFLSRDGGFNNRMRAAFNAGGFQVNNAADGTANTDLTTLQQVTALISSAGVGSKVSKAGDSMTGDLTFDGIHGPRNLPSASVGTDPVILNQYNAGLTAGLATKVTKAGDSMTGNLTFDGVHGPKNLPNGVSSTDPATMSQLNAAIAAAVPVIGGSGIEGALTVLYPAMTLPGFYDFTSITNGARTLPSVSVIRSQGAATISGVLTASRWYGGGTHPFSLAYTKLRQGISSTSSAAAFSAGAGFGGPNGQPTLGWGTNWSTLYHPEYGLPIYVGGCGGYNGGFGGLGGVDGGGGGVIVLIVEGNIDFTGGGLSVDAIQGIPGSNQAGGGGGTIIVLCTGTIISGTFSARGGDSSDLGPGSGASIGGGGGAIFLFASAFASGQIFQVTGGLNNGGGRSGNAGFSQAITMSATNIRGLISSFNSH